MTWKEYPDGRHRFNGPWGMDDTVEFLNKYVVGAGNAGVGSSGEMDLS